MHNRLREQVRQHLEDRDAQPSAALLDSQSLARHLYSSEKSAFNDESEHVGLLFASHAAVAMSGAQQQDQMSKAMSARDLIGQAKGILMERHKVTADQAFTLLARVSQEGNTKLVEVARRLTETGELKTRRR